MRKIAAFLLFLILAGAGLYGYLRYELGKPYKGFTTPVMVEFPHGTSATRMATTLSASGVIAHPWLFLAARVFNRGRKLQAGQYQFTAAASPLDVFGRIARGDIYYMQLLVPEGFNMFDIAGAVAKLGGMTAASFLAAARDPSAIRDLDPQAQTLEGYLFPDTYRVYPKTTARELCLTMTGRFRAQWKMLPATGGMSVHDTVTLASLVEREARLKQEQSLIASVFQNRLHFGMRLDCDPTTVYAALLEGRYTGAIHQSDLASDNPYNTYKHDGLPPGPIANPGLGAIHAAIAPTTTPYLYFVARGDGSGGHTFSQSLQQHEVAVGQYRRATAGH